MTLKPLKDDQSKQNHFSAELIFQRECPLERWKTIFQFYFKNWTDYGVVLLQLPWCGIVPRMTFKDDKSKQNHFSAELIFQRECLLERWKTMFKFSSKLWPIL